MTNNYGSAEFARSNTALTHILYLYMKATICDCCEVDDLYIPPQHINLVSTKVQTSGSMVGNPHWWQATVWARAYHGMNALYGDKALAAAILAEDERRGFWFPDLTQIGNDRRLEKIWRGEIEDRVLSALSGSSSRIWKE